MDEMKILMRVLWLLIPLCCSPSSWMRWRFWWGFYGSLFVCVVAPVHGGDGDSDEGSVTPYSSVLQPQFMDEMKILMRVLWLLIPLCCSPSSWRRWRFWWGFCGSLFPCVVAPVHGWDEDSDEGSVTPYSSVLQPQFMDEMKILMRVLWLLIPLCCSPSSWRRWRFWWGFCGSLFPCVVVPVYGWDEDSDEGSVTPYSSVLQPQFMDEMKILMRVLWLLIPLCCSPSSWRRWRFWWGFCGSLFPCVVVPVYGWDEDSDEGSVTPYSSVLQPQFMDEMKILMRVLWLLIPLCCSPSLWMRWRFWWGFCDSLFVCFAAPVYGWDEDSDEGSVAPYSPVL